MLGFLICYCVTDLLHSLIESLISEITANDVREVCVSFNHFSRSKMLQLDIFKSQAILVVDKCGSCHYRNVFDDFLLNVSHPRHVDGAAGHKFLLVVVDQRAERVLLKIF